MDGWKVPERYKCFSELFMQLYDIVSGRVAGVLAGFGAPPGGFFL